MSNKTIRQTAAGLLIVFCLYLFPHDVYPQKSEDLYAVITKLTGSVFVQLTGKQFPAKLGMGLKQGDSIKTGKDSFVTIVVEDGTIFRIEQNATVRIASIENIPEKKTGNIMKSQVDIPHKGLVFSYVRKFAGYRENHFSIKTPVCTASVRGTGLAVDVEDENTTNVAVFEGRVVVKDFVEESALPEEGNELLLLFLHEVSLEQNKMTTVTKEGIKKPVQMYGKMLEGPRKIAELKQHSAEIEESWKKTTPAQRQSARKKIREEVIR